METDPNTIDSAGQLNLACFEVADRVYAIDVAHVREIVRMQEVTPLPMAPDLIEGGGVDSAVGSDLGQQGFDGIGSPLGSCPITKDPSRLRRCHSARSPCHRR